MSKYIQFTQEKKKLSNEKVLTKILDPVLARL
jgi:hypothetical protein